MVHQFQQKISVSDCEKSRLSEMVGTGCGLRNTKDINGQTSVSLSGCLDVKGQKRMQVDERARGNGIQSTQEGGRIK